MTDKITSVAGLRKAVEDWIDGHNQALPNYGNIRLRQIISEFEASVRERIRELEKPYPFCGNVNHKNEKIEELRRILGGEVPT